MDDTARGSLSNLAFGEDDAASIPHSRSQSGSRKWVTLSERYWVILAEHRSPWDP